jgi:mRNA-degrading endonuclease toxin of MazEF toxin-antitoxin module
VQKAQVSARLPTVLCIPLTTQIDALRPPGTVLVGADAENGLRRTSVALVFQLPVPDQRHIGTRLGNTSASKMAIIWTAFDEITERSTGPTAT